MRLLCQVLRQQHLRPTDGLVAVFVHGTDDELRAVEVVNAASDAPRTDVKQLHGLVVVLRRDAVVEDGAIGDLTGQLHHLVAGRADHDGDVAGFAASVNHVQLDTLNVMEFAVEGHIFHGEQAAQHFDGLAHRLQRLAALDAHIARQGVPPRADAADDAIRGQVIEGEEGGREQADVPRPVVDDARPDFDALGDGGKGGHGDDGVAHQAAFGLPDGLETARLGVTRVLHAIPERMRIL